MAYERTQRELYYILKEEQQRKVRTKPRWRQPQGHEGATRIYDFTPPPPSLATIPLILRHPTIAPKPSYRHKPIRVILRGLRDYP